MCAQSGEDTVHPTHEPAIKKVEHQVILDKSRKVKKYRRLKSKQK